MRKVFKKQFCIITQRVKREGKEEMDEAMDEVDLSEVEFSEDEFSIVVLYRAKELFGDNAKYLRLARMVKLAAFVADDVNFDLTRGWYKHGDYSPNAYMIAKDYSDGDLISLEPPKELANESFEEFKKLIPSIDDSIKKWEPFFIKDQASFYNWVYETKAPEEFKGLYKSHRSIEQFFTPLLTFFRLPKAFQKLFHEKFENLDTLITNYYNHLNHLKDEEILNLFCDFMDLFEMVMLRIKNKNYHVNEDGLIFLQALKETYCNSDSETDLWTLLVPYIETLTGRRAEDEKRWYRSKVNFIKEVLPIKIDILREQAEPMDLLPSAEELEHEIKKYNRKGVRKTLRDTYSSL